MKQSIFYKSILLIVFVAIIGLQSCTVGYSFTGANISPDVKTFTVQYFPNRSKLVNPNLSNQFAEDLKDRLQRQTSLNELKEGGDLDFSGYISNYDVRPMSIQKDDLAAQNRLTITINIKYSNSKDSEQNFEKSFSAFEDFESSQSLSDIEDGLVPEIIEKIIEDIFNATIANW